MFIRCKKVWRLTNEDYNERNVKNMSKINRFSCLELSWLGKKKGENLHSQNPTSLSPVMYKSLKITHWSNQKDQTSQW